METSIEAVEKSESWRNKVMGAAAVGSSMWCPRKFNTESPEDLVVSLLGVCAKEWEIGPETSAQT